MDMSKGNDENLPSQGVLGSPGHSGEPDDAGSTVIVRKSCEGTVGAASASAPAEQAATAEPNPLEMVSCIYTGTPDATQSDDTSVQMTGEKRKASTSPGSEVDYAVGGIARRPNKTRVIESTESPAALSSNNNSPQEDDKAVYSVSDSKTYTESEEKEEFTPDVRVTRANRRRSE